MHKKSIEAAEKLKDDDGELICGATGSDTEKESNLETSNNPHHHKSQLQPVAKEDLRSESIASLRAKAQSYSAKIREEMSRTQDSDGGSTDSKDHETTFHHPYKHSHSAIQQDIGPSSFETPRSVDSCDDRESISPGK